MAQAAAVPERAFKLQQLLPVVGALIVILLLLNVAYQAAMGNTNGTFVYAIDDAYIHLTIARNLVHHGVWGMTGTTATSASSAPLWVLILAALNAVPIDQTLLPLLLNFLLAIAFVAVFYKLAERFVANVWARAAATAIVSAALPVVSLVLSGMENLLHCLLTVIFVSFLLGCSTEKASAKKLAVIALLGAAMVLTRYESAFLFAVPFVWGIYRRRALLIAPMGGAILGVVLFGLASLKAGMAFVPNALLLKTDVTNRNGFFDAMLHRVLANVSPSEFPTTAAIALTGFFAMLALIFAVPRIRLAGATVLLALVLHLCLSTTTVIFRYESYLIAAMAMVVLAAVTDARGSLGLGVKILGGLFCVALVARAVASSQQTPFAVRNIYQQQYQMSRFLSEHYAGKTVALNDIGACSYYSSCKIVDLYGLSDSTVREDKRRGVYDTAEIQRILQSNNVDVAILYPWWYRQYGGLPAPYYLRPVAQWSVEPPDIVLGGDSVVLFAPSPKDLYLAQAARQFRPELPKGVDVDYFQLISQ